MARTLSSDERLYRLAREKAERQFGAALPLLGHALERAVIMAEVAYIVASQDNESNPMVRFAQYAAGAVADDLA